jgi:radical SAM superfamily enzyme YgiQ (UPF0313 family)
MLVVILVKIGILELLGNKASTLQESVVATLVQKQYASVTPQAISVWCRQMGHRVFYATYYGLGDPKARLPSDLDVVFISTHTNTAPLASALSKLYKIEGTRTVIGGPHAKSFPHDCLRYFDLVVLDCDKALIADIISDQFEPESIISSHKPYDDTPTIEERLPEIRASTFLNGRPHPGSFIPMLASMGCPYTCSFCIDWNTPYRTLSSDRLAADLHYAARHLPGVKFGFFDPNFAVRFDETLSNFESVPPGQHNPYFIESSLTVLRSDRLKRLRDTNCIGIAPGVESWSLYSNKAGVGQATHRPKVDQVVEQFHVLREYIPYLGANFIFGLDTDAGDEPFELTKEFIIKVPFVWPGMNTFLPFGGTPLYNTLLGQDRILKTMPFNFYSLPHIVIILKNYDPISYLQKMVDLYTLVSSNKLLKQRLDSIDAFVGKSVHLLRTSMIRNRRRVFADTLHRMQTDAQFLAFHCGETDKLPVYYAYEYKRHLGKYAELMTLEESRPLLSVAEGSPM